MNEILKEIKNFHFRKAVQYTDDSTKILKENIGKS